MNEISGLIRTYNRFIGEIRAMMNDMRSILEDNINLKFVADYWCPRDRSAWSNKEHYYALYYSDSSNFAIVVSCDLSVEIPYIGIQKIKLLKTGLEDVKKNLNYNWLSYFFMETNDECTTKKINERCWKSTMNKEGQYGVEAIYYSKVDILSIKSSEVVQKDILKILEDLVSKDAVEESYPTSVRFIS